MLFDSKVANEFLMLLLSKKFHIDSSSKTQYGLNMSVLRFFQLDTRNCFESRQLSPHGRSPYSKAITFSPALIWIQNRWPVYYVFVSVIISGHDVLSKYQRPPRYSQIVNIKAVGVAGLLSTHNLLCYTKGSR